MNTTNVNDSQVGIVNTGGHIGSVGAISITVDSLKEQGETTLAEAFASLTAALTHSDASEKVKSDTLQNIELLSKEALKPEDQRSSSLMGFVIDHCNQVLPMIEGVSKTWESCKEIFQSLTN